MQTTCLKTPGKKSVEISMASHPLRRKEPRKKPPRKNKYFDILHTRLCERSVEWFGCSLAHILSCSVDLQINFCRPAQQFDDRYKIWTRAILDDIAMIGTINAVSVVVTPWVLGSGK